MSSSSPIPSASQKAPVAELKPKSETSLLSKSAEGATLLIALQIGSRALTFVVGQLLLRFLFPPELFGISTQLEVYSISVLFFARESLRVAIQRQTDEPEPRKSSTPEKEKDDQIPDGHVDGRTAAGKTQAIVNLAYVSIYLGAIFAVILAWLYLRTIAGTPEILNIPYFQEALKLYGFAAVWELLAEPCFVVAQHRSMYKIRAAAEATATLLRCLATCASAVWASRTGHDLGVLPFAMGQATYAVSLAIVYYCSVRSMASAGGFHLTLTPIYSSDISAYVLSYFSRPLVILGTSLFVQLLVKHVLTQGDTILIATFASPVAQGTYALANNYGGLLARLVLQPVEESSRNYFGKLLATVDGKPPKELVMKARSSLLSLLRAYVLLSVCVLAVGPTVAPLLLKVVAGSKWAMSGAGDVLATYCYYIPLLAINGVTEAFVSSVATESEVNRQSVWMLAFSVGFGGSAFIFLRVLELGAEGLVWANVMNMAFRIVWSTVFITSFLRRQGTNLDLGQILPRGPTIAAGVATYAVLARMASTFHGGISDFLKSGSITLVFVVIL
ncbi:Rft-containing protein [Venustampulla echinocandica]|uniref:Man(5)GlcNAc(2)-PP-dolichol translocation protein RFT1 n=1 Tax=Venustampulla echinocandica TaxID=2656787 RepID=A0A370TQZ7_9HELO|nr:Rft-containing protein [Venustampulla echinocandica]RDL37955.1 Rft-containing protein [Venustampulla echinocandica]